MVALVVLMSWEAGLDIQWCPAALRAHGGVRTLGSALGLTISPCGVVSLCCVVRLTCLPGGWGEDLGMSAPTPLHSCQGGGSWAVLYIPISSQVT